jgi:putative peptide zinc metalloprotease protein
VYPAFYTDVTDNYRLARWGKVRTDLGGFYFNMIFGIVMVGLYALTRQDFLLLVIMLIDIEILHQTLPIARLDGYWALADLTGMPDFSLRSCRFCAPCPFLSEKGPGIANLKRWVRVVLPSTSSLRCHC